VAKLRVTWIAEYEAGADAYPGCDADPARMAAIDQASLDEGDLDVADLLELAETISVTVEPSLG